MLYGLNKHDADQFDVKTGKGIILSVHGFEGKIELLNNTITHNHIFIRSAIFSNIQQF